LRKKTEKEAQKQIDSVELTLVLSFFQNHFPTKFAIENKAKKPLLNKK
jgi:hypothetical protein